ncbi:YqaE/Pmp3 family membrane protein [Paenibacillus sp. NPDC055715]
MIPVTVKGHLFYFIRTSTLIPCSSEGSVPYLRIPGQAILNFILCLFFFIPGVIHALVVVNSHKADLRNEELIRAVQRGQNR